jgi:hypothetical protein
MMRSFSLNFIPVVCVLLRHNRGYHPRRYPTSVDYSFGHRFCTEHSSHVTNRMLSAVR